MRLGSGNTQRETEMERGRETEYTTLHYICITMHHGDGINLCKTTDEVS